MAMFALISSLLSAALALAPYCHYNYDPGYASLLNTGMGRPICSNNEYRQIPIEVDGPTKAFHFTTSYAWAFESFSYSSTQSTLLLAWDCFCAGDAFRVYDNGVPLFDAVPEENDFSECNIQVEYPLYCLPLSFGGGIFAGNATLLPPGEHNITIAILSSPFDSGSAFIAIKSVVYGGLPSCLPFASCQFGDIQGQCQQLI